VVGLAAAEPHAATIAATSVRSANFGARRRPNRGVSETMIASCPPPFWIAAASNGGPWSPDALKRF
jgi:hypothetical protein